MRTGASSTNLVSCTSAHGRLSQHLTKPRGPGIPTQMIPVSHTKHHNGVLTNIWPSKMIQDKLIKCAAKIIQCLKKYSTKFLQFEVSPTSHQPHLHYKYDISSYHKLKINLPKFVYCTFVLLSNRKILQMLLHLRKNSTHSSGNTFPCNLNARLT